ncbi:MAG: zinc-ribbon domain-containing protein [Gemmataceae bacterium]|nr:zinc-ribbon domain-containing protein [Gemmataceae bacterium]
MPKTTFCQQCGQELQIPDELMGRMVKCPSCGTTFVATAAGGGGGMTAPVPEPEPQYPEPGLAPRPRDRYEDEYPRRRRSHMQPHRGSLILTLGIVSFFCFSCILGPVSWAMGASDLNKMRNGEMDPEGEGSTRAGMICGIISTILVVIVTIFYVILFAAGGIR